MTISITVERDSQAGRLDCIRKFHLLFQTLKTRSSFCLDLRNYLQRCYSSEQKSAFITILIEVSTTNVMAAPAANKAQPQGPQVPCAPQANVVQDILAKQPPAKPILDASVVLPIFKCMCQHILICPFSVFTCVLLVLYSIQLAFFLQPFFLCCLFASSQSYPIESAFVISSILFQFLASQSYTALFSFQFNFLISYLFCRSGFYFVQALLLNCALSARHRRGTCRKTRFTQKTIQCNSAKISLQRCEVRRGAVLFERLSI